MRKSKKESDWSGGVGIGLLLVTALSGALYLANDTFIMHKVIVLADPFTAVSAYLILGGWVGTVCTLGYNAVLGRWIDPTYPGFNWGKQRMQLFALVSGAIAAGSTAFCLTGNQSLDASLVTALANLSLLYLVFYDGFRGEVSLASIWLPTILIVGGSVLASVTRLSGGFEITLLGILVLLIGRCGTDALEKIVRQRGGQGFDAVTFSFWRFLWLTVTGTLLASGVALARGTLDELFGFLGSIWRPALPWVLLTMFFVFFYNTLYQKAVNSEALSEVSMVVSLQIVLGIPLTLAADRIWPGVFGEIPSDASVWLVRFVGATLMISGVIITARLLDKRR